MSKLQHYLSLLSKNDASYDINDLIETVASFALSLSSIGEIEKATWIWEKITSLTKASRHRHLIWCAYANFLCQFPGKRLAALEALQRCFATAGETAGTMESCENIKSLIVDRWHFRMLNDTGRNLSYRNAIHFVVAEVLRGATTNRCSVLDVGGGTGLLSIYAAQAGATSVYCCEANPDLAQIAEKCIQAHGLQDRIHVIAKHSSELKIGVDLPQRVDVVVTELVDSGLLGEHIVEVLADARARLLVNNGKVIPHSARVWCVPVSSEIFGKRCKLGYYQYASSNFNTKLLKLMRESKSPAMQFQLDESYTCEDMTNLLEVCRLADNIDVGEILLDQQYSSKGNIDVQLFGAEKSFRAKNSGRLDAVAYWFDLKLMADQCDGLGSSYECISTAPGRRDCGWDQAVVFMLENELSLTAGSSYSLKMMGWKDRLQFNIRAVEDCSLSGETMIPTAGSIASAEASSKIFLGEQDFARLNDDEIFDRYITALLQILSLHQAAGNQASLSVYEFCGSWQPITLGALILATSLNAASTSVADEDIVRLGRCILSSIFCPSYHARENLFRPYFEALANHFGLSNRVSVFDQSVVSAYLANSRHPPPCGTSRSCDILLCDVVEGGGLIRRGVLKEIQFALTFCLRSAPLLSTVVPSIIPHELVFCVQLLECPLLQLQHRVEPQSTLEANIAEFINKLGANTLQELQIDALNPSYLSKEVKVGRLELSTLAHDTWEIRAIGTDRKNLGTRSDGNTWWSASIQIERPGCLTAVAYWYEIKLLPPSSLSSTCGGDISHTISTGPKRGNFWRQAALLISPSPVVQEGMTIELEYSVDLEVGFCCKIGNIT